jgi:putative SOS response-associated peptidase YedK
MSKVHHRMPVVVPSEDWALWLGESGHGAARLMRAAADDALVMHRVDRAVNSNRAVGPELIDPYDM